MLRVHFAAESHADIAGFDTLPEVAAGTLRHLQHGAVGLSGGTTYAALFPLWAQAAPECSGASFFPVDERMVPLDDPASNWGQALRLFLSLVNKETDRDHAAISPDAYFRLLSGYFGSMPVIFDTLFLGMGDDGHSASLFPGQPYFDDLSSVVLRTASPKPPSARISLAMAPLIAARTVIVIIAGKEKSGAVKGIFENDQSLPIVKVLSRRKNSLVFMENSLVPPGIIRQVKQS